LFTAGGEVFDTTIINEFVARVQDNFSVINVYPSLDSNIVIYNTSNYTIELLSDTRAKFILESGETLTYAIKRQHGALLFVKDTICTTTDGFNYDWNKFKPVITKTEPIPFGELTYYKPTLFAYQHDDEILIPVISIMVLSASQRSCYFHLKENNSINEDYLSEITDATQLIDSVVFRESRIVFSKQ